MKFATAVFDLDGTLLDTLEDLRDSVNYTLKEYGLPERTLDEVRSFVGNGIRNLVKRSFPAGLSDAELDERTEIYRRRYEANMENKTAPYKGVCELLRELKERGVKIAVVSNKFDFGVKRLCEKYFAGLTDAAVGETSQTARKPAPDSVFAALDALGAAREGALYIGDSETDAETAKNAGLPFLGVSWGFRDKSLLLERGAFRVVDCPAEILELF